MLALSSTPARPLATFQRILQPIRSTCPLSLLLATLASSSHSLPRCHDLLFQPTQSQLLVPDSSRTCPLRTSGSVCFHTSPVFFAPGLIWCQKTQIFAWGLMFSGLLPTNPLLLSFYRSFKWRWTHSGRSNMLLASSNFLASPSCTSTPTTIMTAGCHILLGPLLCPVYSGLSWYNHGGNY